MNRAGHMCVLLHVHPHLVLRLYDFMYMIVNVTVHKHGYIVVYVGLCIGLCVFVHVYV